MDYEMVVTNVQQDMCELAEQYETAASNERLWAKGAPDDATAQMHEANVERLLATAQMYRQMAENAKTVIDTFMIG